jgi:hypothetical protein
VVEGWKLYRKYLVVFTAITSTSNVIKPILLLKTVKYVTSDYDLVIAVNNTTYCKHSQVLLMMGENIVRNM